MRASNRLEPERLVHQRGDGASVRGARAPAVALLQGHSTAQPPLDLDDLDAELVVQPSERLEEAPGHLLVPIRHLFHPSREG